MIDSLLVNPHIADYVASLVGDLPEWLEEAEQKARREEVPIIRKEAQGLLQFFLAAKKPTEILEIGTAVGFSASLMAYYTNFAVPITTIEKVPARIREATERFQSRSELSCITLIPGDAEAVLTELEANGNRYSFIFLDAAKAQYPAYLSHLKHMMKDGTILITDNILQEGSLAESKFTITRRDRTIHMRMREFVESLFHDDHFTSTLLPVGDGMTVSVYSDR